MTLEEAYRPIRPHLDRVEEEIRTQATEHLAIFAQGKRLRPALLIFAARPGDGSLSRDAAVAAAAIEMIHTASLIHDDVIDDSPERRERPALFRVMGMRPAIVFADYLFVQGLTSLEAVEPSSVLPMVVRDVRTMCEGQLREMTAPSAPGFDEAGYLDIIDKKTAALFSCACRVGGLLRGASSQEMGDLAEFGRLFGFVYQLMDDARDLSGEHIGDLERKLVEWGGKDYCERKARAYAGRAGEVAARLPDASVREGFEKTLNCILEV